MLGELANIRTSADQEAMEYYLDSLPGQYSCQNRTLALMGGVAQWLERRSMTGELSLVCTMTCS